MSRRFDAAGRDVTDLPGLWDESDSVIEKGGSTMYFPDPIEQGEARAGRWERDLNCDGESVDCAGCKKRIKLADSHSASADPWAPPICDDCLNAKFPSREWLKKMADTEDACGSISVGGLASEMGMLRERERDCRELAERAVLALHFRHAGLFKPEFKDCREGLCADWHDLQR